MIEHSRSILLKRRREEETAAAAICHRLDQDMATERTVADSPAMQQEVVDTQHSPEDDNAPELRSRTSSSTLVSDSRSTDQPASHSMCVNARCNVNTRSYKFQRTDTVVAANP